MKFIYGLATYSLVLAATAALTLGQTPNKAGESDAPATVAVMDHVWLDAGELQRNIQSDSRLRKRAGPLAGSGGGNRSDQALIAIFSRRVSRE